MTSISGLLAPFKIEAVNEDPQPKGSIVERPGAHGKTIYMTGCDDVDFSFEIASNPYGMVTLRSIGKIGDTAFYSAMITREEVDKVLWALERARDVAFSSDPLTAP